MLITNWKSILSLDFSFSHSFRTLIFKILYMSTEHDSDSDSELSLDEHSSSYASSHSSDSEDDVIETEKKWNSGKNNDRGPVHSTPKGKEVTTQAIAIAVYMNS